MIKQIITVGLALNFLHDPVGHVEAARDVGAPIVVSFFSEVLTPAVHNVNKQAAEMAGQNGRH